MASSPKKNSVRCVPVAKVGPVADKVDRDKADRDKVDRDKVDRDRVDRDRVDRDRVDRDRVDRDRVDRDKADREVRVALMDKHRCVHPVAARDVPEAKVQCAPLVADKVPQVSRRLRSPQLISNQYFLAGSSGLCRCSRVGRLLPDDFQN